MPLEISPKDIKDLIDIQRVLKINSKDIKEPKPWKDSLHTSLSMVSTSPSKGKAGSILYERLFNLSDQILEEGLPIRCEVFLYEKLTGVLLKTAISDLEGYFTFYNLSTSLEYLISANDNKYQFKSIIKNYNI